MTFYELYLKKIVTDNCLTTHFTKEGWLNIVKNFGAQIGRRHKITQLKNKWDQLKND